MQILQVKLNVELNSKVRYFRTQVEVVVEVVGGRHQERIKTGNHDRGQGVLRPMMLVSSSASMVVRVCVGVWVWVWVCAHARARVQVFTQ